MAAAADTTARIQQSRVSRTWRATDGGDETGEIAAEATAAEDIGTDGTAIA